MRTNPARMGDVWVCLVLALVAAPGVLRAQEAAAKPRFKVEYATYLGGTYWEEAREIIVYPDDSVLVGAHVCSSGLPTTPGCFQPSYADKDPATAHSNIWGGDYYLARLSADGGKILAATYFGGSKGDRAVYGMELDSKGNIVIAGGTGSPDAPTTPGCFQPKPGGKADMLVAKLSPDLRKLLWCIYIGGSGVETPRGGLVLEKDDSVILVGSSSSPNFPTTPGVVQPTLKGPRDSVVLRLKPDGSGLIFSTFLGGMGEDDAIMGVRLDAAGNINVAGHTKSTDFPTTAGAFQREARGKNDGFVTKLSADGKRLVFSTRVGGTGSDNLLMPTVDKDGNIWVVGNTTSRDFPVTPDALQAKYGGGQREGDGLLAEFSPDGSKLLYATYLGGSGDEMIRSMAFGPKGEIYLVGTTSSPDFPTTPAALQPKLGGDYDALIVKLVPVR